MPFGPGGLPHNTVYWEDDVATEKKKRTPRKLPEREPEETFYRVQIIDAERGKIRFGPFTADETPEAIAKKLRETILSDNPEGGLENALLGISIWGGFEVWLKGDDGTDLLICEIGPQ